MKKFIPLDQRKILTLGNFIGMIFGGCSQESQKWIKGFIAHITSKIGHSHWRRYCSSRLCNRNLTIFAYGVCMVFNWQLREKEADIVGLIGRFNIFLEQVKSLASDFGILAETNELNMVIDPRKRPWLK